MRACTAGNHPPMTTRTKERPALRPRIVNDAQLAAYLGKSVSWLAMRRHELEAQGLPRRLPVVGGNDLHAVDQWLDQLRTPILKDHDPQVERLWQEATRNVRF
jgi:hypothetical protein